MRAVHFCLAICALGLLAFSVSAAGEVPTQVFGVVLGTPLALPTCPPDTSGVSWNSSTATLSPVDFPECIDALGVHFASGHSPTWVHFEFFNVEQTDGVVAKIEIFTRGISVEA